MDWFNRLQQPRFWLLGIAGAIVALHLALINRNGNSELFATSALFWAAAGSLLWDKRQTLKLESGTIASLVGALLLGLILLRSASLSDAGQFLRFLPIVSLVGLALLASGGRGLRQYWREFLIFGLFALIPLLELWLQLIDLSTLTAKAAAFMLWYSGFPVDRQGTFLYLLRDRVQVYGSCSGLQSILQMLSISVLFLLTVPLRSWHKNLLCLVVAVGLGFLVNAARVMLMTMLVSQKSAFNYWHEGEGSLVFSMIAVLLFGGFCWLAFLRDAPGGPDSGASTHG